MVALGPASYNLPSAMKGGCSILLLCLAAVALITFGMGIVSVGFPSSASAASFRAKIVTNIIFDASKPSPSYTTRSSSSTPSSSSFSSPPVLKLVGDAQDQSLTSAGECGDLFRGKWVVDEEMEPLYSNNSCPILTSSQNCDGNGRPDRRYVKWRWRPRGCGLLPRFDAGAFFRLMAGRTLAFVGDSVARNHMESLMCALWQVEVPVNKGSRKMHRWFFRSHSVTIIRIWSAWLVNTTNEPFACTPAGLTKLQLETPDDAFMQFLPTFDVLVVSSGHWYTKKTAYISGGRLVGAQLWSDKRLPGRPMKNPDAFAIAMQTAMMAITSHPHYKGLTILRTYSPDHYEGGAWNTGGSCTGKTQPATDTELVSNGYTDLMRRHQLHAFSSVQHNITNGSTLRLLDVTPVFSYRADGHPGPYRSRDPNKVTQRGPHGEPPPQDCLHWCMPGPIDTWNDLLLEIIRRVQSFNPPIL